MREDDTMRLYYEACFGAMAKFGMKFRIGNDIGELLEAAGWTNVTKRVIKTPIGTWPKVSNHENADAHVSVGSEMTPYADPLQDKTLRLCGMYMQTILNNLIGALSAKPLRMLGWSDFEVELLAANSRKDLKNNDMHAYLNYLFWTAQKPGSDGKEVE